MASRGVEWCSYFGKKSGVLSEVMHIPYELAIPLLCIGFRHTITQFCNGIWQNLLSWRQTGSPSLGEWIYKMHTIQELEAIALWEDLKNTLSSKRKRNRRDLQNNANVKM